MFYIKRALVVEAFKLGVEPIPDWARHNKNITFHNDIEGTPFVEIETSRGVLIAERGDCIIKDFNGSVFACDIEEFNLNYDIA